MAPGQTVSDFSSPTYWSNRFSTEKSFEWLIPSHLVVPLALDHITVHETRKDAHELEEDGGGGGGEGKLGGKTLRGLHLGCGTSDLGAVIQAALQNVCEEEDVEMDIRVIDSDYVADTITRDDGSGLGSGSGSKGKGEGAGTILALDCLDLDDLVTKSRIMLGEGRGWDFIIDKSTSDAISCGPLIPLPLSEFSARASANDHIDIDTDLEPLEVLLANMAKVTRKGGKWISISYSEKRYACLTTCSKPGSFVSQGLGGGEGEGYGWRVLDKRFLASTSLPEGRRWRDKQGVERVVYEPETGVWGWVLERI
jgi:hypothetical protein